MGTLSGMASSRCSALIIKTICLALTLVFLGCPPVKAETLTAGVETWIPWIIKQDRTFSGIAVEITKAAFRRTGHRCVMVETPVKRRDMLEWGRSVTVEPGCDRRWRIRQETVSVYTKPYISTRNVIVARKGYYPSTRSITTFYGTTIGANAGYYYTDGFTQAFEKGQITRDNCRPGHLLISKLVKKRFHAIVADTYEWKYWMKTLGHDTRGFEEVYTFSHANDLRIRLHKDKAHLVAPLNRALEAMQADGTVQTIVSLYLPE